MISHTDFIKYFGLSLQDEPFISFLQEMVPGLVDYAAGDDLYMISRENGVEIGFTNCCALFIDSNGAILENLKPVFSHLTLYPPSLNILDKLPFNTNFSDRREAVISRAGTPTVTNAGFSALLNKKYLVDNYKIADIVVTYDYNADSEAINFIQIRDNELVQELKL